MTEPSAAAQTIKPTKRNALVTWLIPTVCVALAPPLGALLGTTAFRLAPNAAILCGVLIALAVTHGMIAELNAAAGSELKSWHLLIPFYNVYWAAVLVRNETARAKQKANKGQPRSVVVYFLFFLYALAADLNDLA